MDALTKLHRLTAKQKLTAADVTFALDNWTDASFPKRLESKVRQWMKTYGLNPKYEALQVQYAPLDEKSASVLIDPCIKAQLAILKLGDKDDLAILMKRAVNFTSISVRLWAHLVEHLKKLPTRTVNKLKAREDIPRKFADVFSDDEPAAKSASRRRSGGLEYEEPKRVALVGKVRIVRKARETAPEESDQYDIVEKPAKRAKPAKAERVEKQASSKTVKKSSAIEKIRAVVKPAKPLSVKAGHKVSSRASTTSKKKRPADDFDETKVRQAARKVRRPAA